MVAAFSPVAHNDERVGVERTSISPRQAEWCRGEGRAKQQVLNITDPALGKGNAQQDGK